MSDFDALATGTEPADTTCTDPAARYRDDGYAPLPGLLDPSWAAFFCRYVRTLLEAGWMQPDQQVPGSAVAYGDPLFDTLLDAVAPEISQRLTLDVLPTYSFLRVYFSDTLLVPHTDRPECEVSVTLHLGADGARRWPVRLTDRQGRDVSVELGPGDALAYDGAALAHWREAYDGEWYAQVFLHFVTNPGPYAHRHLDGRSSLGVPKDGPATRAAATSLQHIGPDDNS